MTMRARPGRKRIQSELLTGGERALRDALGQVDEVLGIAFEVQTTKGGTAGLALDTESGTLHFRDGRKWRVIGGQQGSTEQPAGNAPAESGPAFAEASEGQGYLAWGSNSGMVTCPFTFASDLTVGGGLRVGSLEGVLKAASGAVGVVGIGSSLQYSAGNLNTIQGIRTADSPEFAGLTLSSLTSEVVKVGATGILAKAVKGTDYAGIDHANIFTAAQSIKLDSTAALNVKKADGTDVLLVDTTNQRLGIGVIPTSKLHIKGLAGDGTLLRLDGASNDYSGAAANYGIYLTRDVQPSAGGAPNLTSYGTRIVFRNYYIETGAGSFSPINYGFHSLVTVYGAHSASVGIEEANVGFQNQINREGTLSSPLSVVRNYGSSNVIVDSMSYDNAAGTLEVNNYGGYFYINQSGELTAGTWTKRNYGFYAEVVGSDVGTTVNYGAYIMVRDAVTNWGFYNASAAAHNFLGLDNVKTYFGTSQDASIYFNGTNLIINAQEIAGGYLVVMSLKTTTGDPAGVEGLIYWNTFDNAIKMYADGAFRTLASW